MAVQMTHKASKFEAAESQLTTAIDLYFKDGDIYSIHTLACAAYEILDTLCAKQGLERGVVHEGTKLLKPEHRKKATATIFAMKNYLKHADRDSEMSAMWNPELSTYFMWDAAVLCCRLNGNKMSNPILLYSVWFMLTHDVLWDKPSILTPMIPEAKGALALLGKRKYYENFLNFKPDQN